MNTYTITASLPYANGPIHIGHIAGAYLPADIYTRYLRMNKKNNVLFICGSDEHGAAISIKAIQEQKSPQDIINKYHFLNEKSFKKLGISFDIYYRTSEILHHKLVKEIFTNLFIKNFFISKSSNQFYDKQYDQFLADRYIIGICPLCNYDKAYGDQCENCGNTFNSLDLISPKSVLSSIKPILKLTKNLYIPLEKWHKWIQSWISKQNNIWKNNIYHQCVSWINIGLKARSVTRDLNWGIDVPIYDFKNKKIYVWFDAPIGYISATIKWASSNNKDWTKYWKIQPNTNNNAKLIHFIGKDNIFFHAIIFPIILYSCGDYILPYNIPANEFLKLEGKKISKSKNHAVLVHEYLKEMPNKEDMLRYVLCSILPENKDSEFKWIYFKNKVNNELIAIYGNYINRILVLTDKILDNTVPQCDKLYEIDHIYIEKMIISKNKISNLIENFLFKDALKELINVARHGNKYLNDNQPWKIVATNYKRVNTILHISLHWIISLAIMSYPFLPFTAKKIFNLLNINPIDNWVEIGNMNMLKYGHKIKKSEILFEKITNDMIKFQINKLYCK